VTLRGEHDATSSEAVTLALAVARDYGTILVDLGECTFVDSALISALLLAAKRARKPDGALELVVPAEANAVRRTLEIANVQMLLPFHATLEAGIAGIGTPKPPSAGHPNLHAVSAKIDRLHARSETRRAAGSLILRAQVVADGVSLAKAPTLRAVPAKPAPQEDSPADWGEQAA
jgi:anti-anti-sigma factor